MRIERVIFGICVLGLLGLNGTLSEVSAATTKCARGTVVNYLLKGKCVSSTAATAGKNLFAAKGCAVCHSISGSACPQNFGPGSCSYKKMAKLLKASNKNKTKVPASVLLTLYHAYAPYMSDSATPSSSDASKYINYLATLKQ